MYKNLSGVGLRSESELLLCIARTHINPQTASRIRALVGQGPDWHYLISTASSHGVLPLLYRSLARICPESVPAARFEFLRQYYELNKRRSFLLTCELLRCIKAFEQGGVHAVSFKGPILAASIYGNLALRQFNDLDIVVRKRDISKAKDILISRGYSHLGSRTAPNQGTQHLRTDLEPDQLAPLRPNFYIFVRHGVKIRVDLQWRVTDRLFSFSIDSESFWNNLDSFILGRTTLLTFPPEILLLILCAHGCKHSWQKLKWVCDVAQLIEVLQSKGQLTRVKQALLNGNRRMVCLGLLLAHDLLGATLPDEVIKEIRLDSVATSVATQIRQRLFAETDEAVGEAGKFIFYLKMRASWAERLKYCSEYLAQYSDSVFSPSPIERDILPLPKSLAFLHYGFRPLRLAAKYGLAPFKRSHGRS